MSLVVRTPPVLYNDIGKKASDLLNKEFPDKAKFELKTKTSNGVVHEVSLTRNGDGLLGSINPKYTFVKQGVTVGITADTDKNTKFELTVDKLVPGLKLSTIVDSKKLNAIQFDGEYKHDYAALNGSMDVLNNDGTEAAIAGVVGYEGFSVGLQSKFSRGALSAVNGTAAYTTNDYVFTLFGHFKSNRIGVSYFHKVTPNASAGFDATFDLDKAQAPPSKLTVGGSYQLDVDTTVKGKLDTDGQLSFSYAQRLNKYARLVVGTSFNIYNHNQKSGHSYGFTFSLND
jgi:voltage-dependent anion channel protein 2